MKTNILLILVLMLIQFPVMSQERASQRCFFYDYTADVSTTEDADKIWEDKMILVVQENYTVFESYSFYQRSIAIQAMKKKGLSSQEFTASLSSLPSSDFTFTVQRDYKQQQSTYLDKIIRDHYRYREPLDTPKWTVHPESRQIDSLNCQRATIEQFGRKFEAWFTEEIPLQEGPYKFYGLPGLIVEIYDQNKDHHFVLTGSESSCDYPKVKRSANYLDVTRQEYLQALRKYYNGVFTAMAEAGNVAGDAEFRKIADEDMRRVDNLIEWKTD